MIRDYSEDELYLLNMYKADTVAELMDMLDNSRQFAADSISADMVSNLMLKVGYLTDEELKSLQKQYKKLIIIVYCQKTACQG